MNKQKLKTKPVNNPDQLKIEFSWGDMEARLAYFNLDETNASEYKQFIIVLILLIGIVAFVCEKWEKAIISNDQQMISLQQQTNSPVWLPSSAISRHQAYTFCCY
jgi:hypothetical protein